MSTETSFDTYIIKVLRQVHPGQSITEDAKSQTNYFLNVLAEEIIDEVVKILNRVYKMKKKRSPDRKTISSRDIQSAIRIILPGSLAKHAISEGTKAVTKYTSASSWSDYSPNKRSKKSSKAGKAGLQFPPSRIKTLMKNQTRQRIGDGAPVYLAAVLEYISAELLELSGNNARNRGKTRISAEDLAKAIENDEELDTLANKLDLEVLY